MFAKKQWIVYAVIIYIIHAQGGVAFIIYITLFRHFSRHFLRKQQTPQRSEQWLPQSPRRTGALALPYFIHCHCRISSIYAPAPKWYGAYVRKDILPISYMVKYRTMLNAVFKQCLGHHILRRSEIIYGIIHGIFINLTWVILDSLLR